MHAEIERLLAPVSSDLPAGENREYEADYIAIREARESDPDYLPQDEWAAEIRTANWPDVLRRSKALIQSSSKDFTVICWLTESWVQLEQLSGLEKGFSLLAGMIERYWENGWPALEEEGGLIRAGKFSWLDKKLNELLLNAPQLSEPQSALSFWHQVLRIAHNQNMSGGDDQGADEAFSMATYQHWAAGQNSQQINAVKERVSHCRELINSVNLQAQAHAFEEPLFTLTIQRLDDIEHFMDRLAEMIATEPDVLLSANVVAMNASGDTTFSQRETATRPQALTRDVGISQMLTIAHFFRQTEPSSPVPFLLERAARWANMSLVEWLEEMLDDSNSLNDINSVLKGQRKE